MSSLTKKYSLLLVIFVCSLSIPYLLYTVYTIPIQYDVLSKPYEYPPMVKYSFRWPNITSFNKHNPTLETFSRQQEEIYRKIDQKFCGQDRCKFLLPISITEQGKKKKITCLFLSVIFIDFYLL